MRQGITKSNSLTDTENIPRYTFATQNGYLTGNQVGGKSGNYKGTPKLENNFICHGSRLQSPQASWPDVSRQVQLIRALGPLLLVHSVNRKKMARATGTASGSRDAHRHTQNRKKAKRFPNPSKTLQGVAIGPRKDCRKKAFNT